MTISIPDLKESNEFLNILYDNITSAILIVDHDIKIQAFNNSFGTLFRKDNDEIIEARCGNALGCIHTYNENVECGQTSNCDTCTLRNSLIRAFLHKVPTTKSIVDRQFVIGGEIFRKHFQFSTRTILFENREMVLVIIDDITTEKQQQEELDRRKSKLEEMLGESNRLMSMAAHDLRNPMASIQNLADILKKNLPEEIIEGEIGQLIDIVKERSQYSIRLLNEFLDISRLESGGIKLQKEKISYNGFLKKIVEMQRMHAATKSIEIEFEDDTGKEIFLTMDKDKIEQVFSNLLNNAIKYSFKEHHVLVKLEIDGKEVTTHVIDKGQGIREEEQDNLFKPYKKTSNKPTYGESSTGLGLAISKNLIEAHGGKINVESLYGKGSDFYFSLPLE